MFMQVVMWVIFLRQPGLAALQTVKAELYLHLEAQEATWWKPPGL
jgi:hypothetical protein